MSNNMQKDPTHKCSFTLCRNGCIGMYDAHSQETKLPEEYCLESCPFGKCHTGRHGATSVTHFNKCDCKCHSPQKEEGQYPPLSNRGYSFKVAGVKEESIVERPLHISSEALLECSMRTKDLISKAKQEVISLCLEKIEWMKVKGEDLKKFGNSERVIQWNRALQTVSDEIKGIK